MPNLDVFTLICLIAALWLLRATFVAYLDYRVSIHRINSDHTTASQYWAMVHSELKKQKAFNEQLMALLNLQTTKTENGQ